MAKKIPIIEPPVRPGPIDDDDPIIIPPIDDDTSYIEITNVELSKNPCSIGEAILLKVTITNVDTKYNCFTYENIDF